MPQMPKRVKFRKVNRGVVRGKTTRKKYNGAIKGNANRGNYVAYGDYGLQSLEGGWLSAEFSPARSPAIRRSPSPRTTAPLRRRESKSFTCSKV